MTETAELLKAKIEAVEALAATLDTARKAGTIVTAEDAHGLAVIWLDAMRSMVPTAEATGPQVWVEGDPEPPIGTRVRDKDGDNWERVSEGWLTKNGDGPSSWSWITSHFGPLVRI
jgi:hypothetical protein